MDQSHRLALSLSTLLLILYAGLSRWPQLRPGLQAIGVVGLFLVAGLVLGDGQVIARPRVGGVCG